MIRETLRVTDEQAHEIAISIRATEFALGVVDWQTVRGIADPLLAIADVPPKAQATAAASMVALIRRHADGMQWRGKRVNLETMAAIFDVLSEGRNRQGCTGSEHGHHVWAPSEINPLGTTPVRIPPKNRRCQACGLQG